MRKRAIGFVETPASVTVRSRIDSQIMEQHVTDGQFVKAGDLLFTLDDRDIKAQIAKDEADDRAGHGDPSQDAGRPHPLQAVAARAMPARSRQVDHAVADEEVGGRDRARPTRRRSTPTSSSSSYTTITAPIAGRIGAVHVTPANPFGRAPPAQAAPGWSRSPR